MPEDEDKKKDEESKDNAEASKESSDDTAEEIKPFANLDGREVKIFGWEPDSHSKCWYDLSQSVKSFGWTDIAYSEIENSLKRNIDDCYFQIAQLWMVDLDDDIKYHAYFDNMKGLWKLEIADSPKAELETQQVADFFKSDLMKKAAKQCYTIVTRAAKEFEESLREPFERGKFLKIDEVKLAAELELINQDVTMENLRTCKWMTS